MAKIYGQANRVLVWLGEVHNSNRVFDYIRVAAQDGVKASPSHPEKEKETLNLLKQPWFSRMWVLQEVAAARRILIMCGPSELTGYAFCLGFNNLDLVFQTKPALRSLIRSVTYLMMKAIFRPVQTASSQGAASLGELIDLYHTRKATRLHDKVYALLVMSSDRSGASDLAPDYSVPWEKLLQNLIRFILSPEISVHTWNEEEVVAVIQGKGKILGQVSSAKGDNEQYEKQHVEIVFAQSSSTKYWERWGTRWTIQASAKSIQRGDLVCLLKGASKPTIIRAHRDYSTVIVIAVTLPRITVRESQHRERLEPSELMEEFSRDFLLVWSWENSQDKLQAGAENNATRKADAQMLEYLEETSEEATRLYNMALIVRDSREYQEAERRLREAITRYEVAGGRDSPQVLAGLDNLAAGCKDQEKWKEAEELFGEVIHIRKRKEGPYHRNTLNSMANLASCYIAQGLSRNRDLDTMSGLVQRIRANDQIPGEEVVKVARSFDRRFLSLLLDLGSDKVTITQEVVSAAVENEQHGKDVVTLLLERRGRSVTVSQEIVMTAVKNVGRGREVMELLLQQRGNEFQITEEVVKAAVGNRGGGEALTALLLERGGRDFITGEVVEAAARNTKRGLEVMRLLLDELENRIPITGKVIEAAAGNEMCGKAVMELLLERRGEHIWITKEVMQTAAKNIWSGNEVVKLLLERRRNEVQITKGVVKAAEKNWWKGREVMMLLLTEVEERNMGGEAVVAQIARMFDSAVMQCLFKRRNRRDITERIVTAAAGNKEYGQEVLAFLLERVGDSLITEEVVKAAISNEAGIGVLAFLLERKPGVLITEGVVRAAAGNEKSREMAMILLLDRRQDHVRIEREAMLLIRELFGNAVTALLPKEEMAAVEEEEVDRSSSLGRRSYARQI